MKHNHRRRPAQTRRTSPSVLERLQVDVAGIDCGAADHFVSVPPDRDPAPVQAFRTFTADLQRLADWLVACGITSVAMEATGVYWIPVYDILEARGLEVLLVNARHVKHVPGRKSDVQDSEWLRELHSVGLLRGSFRPLAAILALRALLRHRDTLVKSAGTYVQRMQKALIEMNLLLPRVVSDITGRTGLHALGAEIHDGPADLRVGRFGAVLWHQAGLAIDRPLVGVKQYVAEYRAFRVLVAPPVDGTVLIAHGSVSRGVSVGSTGSALACSHSSIHSSQVSLLRPAPILATRSLPARAAE